MLYLLITIALNAYLFVAFKIFERFRVDALQAIIINYWVCVITGSIFLGRFPVSTSSAQQPWFLWAIIMGASFISIFNLTAYCIRIDGLTTSTIANKLSMVIPVAFALWLYADRMTLSKGLGIALAFPAVYLCTRVKDHGKKAQNLFWPALLFFSSGLLDTLVTFVVKRYFASATAHENAEGQSIFLIHAFTTAGVVGLILLIFLLITGKRCFAWRNVYAGVLLGIPNFFSIYYLFQLLESGYLPGSAAIPVNNIGIVLVASLIAIFAFKEKVNAARLIGMLFSIVAILLIMLSDLNVHPV